MLDCTSDSAVFMLKIQQKSAKKCNIPVLFLLFVSHSEKDEYDSHAPCYVRKIAKARNKNRAFFGSILLDLQHENS